MLADQFVGGIASVEVVRRGKRKLKSKNVQIRPANSKLQNVEETVEDMLTRLDEFENLVNMVRTDGEFCVDISIPQVLYCKKKLELLCDRIDRLEQFVNHVKADVDSVEIKVEEAEAEVGQNVGKFKNIFKPLFFKKPLAESSSKKCGRTPTYEAPSLFATSNFFPQSEDVLENEITETK